MTIYLTCAVLIVLAILLYVLVHDDVPKRHRVLLIWILMLGVLGVTQVLTTGHLTLVPWLVPP